MPRGWETRRTERGIAARSGHALVSVTSFALVKPYDPAKFASAAKELDRVASRLAAQSGGTVTAGETTTVDGRKIRAYDLSTPALAFRIGFVLLGKLEYQLLCQAPTGQSDPDGACALLFRTFATT